MKPKTLATLGAVTAVVAAAAAWMATRTPPGVSAGDAAGGPLFAELRERVNEVAEVTVTSAAESFTLRRGDDGWGLADKAGYPVDVGKVKELVVGVAELDLVEEKTANPELWPRLDVQDPGSDPEAPSQRVRLATAGGEVLADVIVGRSQPGRTGSSSTVYVRRADGGPALEARGRVRVDGSASSWLDREIAKLERKRVREVTVSQPDGTSLRVFRSDATQNDFDVADLPEGAELAWAGVAGGVAGALEYLNLEDVLPAAEAGFDPAEAVAARFVTFDGLVVTARTMERDDGKALLSVEVAFDSAERVEPPAGPPPAEEGAEQAPAPPAGKSVEEVTAEAEAIGARVDGWVYVVPGYSAANLRKRMQDLLKQPEEELEQMFDDPPADEPGGAAEGAPGTAPDTAAEQPATPPPDEPGGGDPSVDEPAGGDPSGGGGEPVGGEPGGGRSR